MRFCTALSALLAVLPALALASPVLETEAAIIGRALGQTGSYTISGLGNRKKQLIACGATHLDMAIAMLETDRMTTDYVYGDNKSYDAANFGIFKQNWGMLRQSTSRYRGKTVNDYHTGAELNSNLCLDINLRHESQNHFGEGLFYLSRALVRAYPHPPPSLGMWLAGHRNGASGLSNPNTQDIQNYKDAIYWIRNQLQYYNNGADMISDVRFWVDVPAI